MSAPLAFAEPQPPGADAEDPFWEAIAETRAEYDLGRHPLCLRLAAGGAVRDRAVLVAQARHVLVAVRAACARARSQAAAHGEASLARRLETLEQVEESRLRAWAALAYALDTEVGADPLPGTVTCAAVWAGPPGRSVTETLLALEEFRRILPRLARGLRAGRPVGGPPADGGSPAALAEMVEARRTRETDARLFAHAQAVHRAAWGLLDGVDEALAREAASDGEPLALRPRVEGRSRPWLASPMAWGYTGDGLALTSAFELPGIAERGDTALPTLALRRIARDRLRRAWGVRARRPPVWERAFGDSHPLRLYEGPAGDRLLTCGDAATFHLDASASSLSCAPRIEGLAWLRLLTSNVLGAVSVVRGYEALNAAAVCSPQGAVAIVAQSRTGRSALAIELVRSGWPLLSDGVLALDRVGGVVRAHAGLPHTDLDRRSWAAERAGRIGEVLGEYGGELSVAVRGRAGLASPVRAVCMLERGNGQRVAVRDLAAGPLRLMPHVLDLKRAGDLAGARFELYAQLSAQARLLSLRVGSGTTPEAAAAALRNALAAPHAP